MSNVLRQFAAGTVVVILTGCILFETAPPPPPYVVQAAMPLPPQMYRRLLLLPPIGDGVPPEHLGLLMESLRLSLTEAGYLVVAPPGTAAAEAEGGSRDPAVMAALAEKANADLVVAVDVVDYRPYPPPRIALVVRAYAPGNQEVLWQLRGSWDLNEHAVAERYRRFRRDHVHPELARLQHRAVVEAPREFLRFVAHEIAAALPTEPAEAVAVEGGAQ